MNVLLSKLDEAIDDLENGCDTYQRKSYGKKLTVYRGLGMETKDCKIEI